MQLTAAQPVATRGGGTNEIPGTDLDALRSRLGGSLLSPSDSEYEVARRIWNGMVSRRPALIARCSGAADVIECLRFAGERDLLFSVRGGGHNIAGNALCDGGLVVDVSPLRGIHVDPTRRRAHVGAGGTLADLDHETQAFGLATPVGINSTTGIAGLTLGGGFGWLSRRFGLTIDNLRSADVVTADGKLLRASDDENGDLFWGIRGGGGNFGVVTRFELDLHEVGPEVSAGLVVFPLEQARGALEQYRTLARELDDDTSIWVVMRHAPPLPFLPPEVHGRKVVVFAMFSLGPDEAAQRVADRIRGFGSPAGEHVGRMPYLAWQKVFDPLLTPGARNYWKSHNFERLSDGALDVLLDHAERLPSPHCEVFLGQLGGAVNRVAPDATAYAHRNTEFVMNVHGRWETPAEDDACIGWARSLFHAAAAHASGGVYVNFMTEEESDRVRLAYGPNYDRLVALKNELDPSNRFCLNQNIAPTTASLAAELDVTTREKAVASAARRGRAGGEEHP